MKKFNTLLMLSMLGLGVFSNEVNASATADKLYTCAQKHINEFDKLTMTNIFSQQGKIENLRKALLNVLENANDANYNKLKEALSVGGVSSLKAIVANLPSKTKSLLETKINDPMIRRYLGL